MRWAARSALRTAVTTTASRRPSHQRARSGRSLHVDVDEPQFFAAHLSCPYGFTSRSPSPLLVSRAGFSHLMIGFPVRVCPRCLCFMCLSLIPISPPLFSSPATADAAAVSVQSLTDTCLQYPFHSPGVPVYYLLPRPIHIHCYQCHPPARARPSLLQQPSYAYEYSPA